MFYDTSRPISPVLSSGASRRQFFISFFWGVESFWRCRMSKKKRDGKKSRTNAQNVTSFISKKKKNTFTNWEHFSQFCQFQHFLGSVPSTPLTLSCSNSAIWRLNEYISSIDSPLNVAVLRDVSSWIQTVTYNSFGFRLIPKRGRGSVFKFPSLTMSLLDLLSC